MTDTDKTGEPDRIIDFPHSIALLWKLIFRSIWKAGASRAEATWINSVRRTARAPNLVSLRIWILMNISMDSRRYEDDPTKISRQLTFKRLRDADEKLYGRDTLAEYAVRSAKIRTK